MRGDLSLLTRLKNDMGMFLFDASERHRYSKFNNPEAESLRELHSEFVFEWKIYSWIIVPLMYKCAKYGYGSCITEMDKAIRSQMGRLDTYLHGHGTLVVRVTHS